METRAPITDVVLNRTPEQITRIVRHLSGLSTWTSNMTSQGLAVALVEKTVAEQGGDAMEILRDALDIDD